MVQRRGFAPLVIVVLLLSINEFADAATCADVERLNSNSTTVQGPKIAFVFDGRNASTTALTGRILDGAIVAFLQQEGVSSTVLECFEINTSSDFNATVKSINLATTTIGGVEIPAYSGIIGLWGNDPFRAVEAMEADTGSLNTTLIIGPTHVPALESTSLYNGRGVMFLESDEAAEIGGFAHLVTSLWFSKASIVLVSKEDTTELEIALEHLRVGLQLSILPLSLVALDDSNDSLLDAQLDIAEAQLSSSSAYKNVSGILLMGSNPTLNLKVIERLAVNTDQKYRVGIASTQSDATKTLLQSSSVIAQNSEILDRLYVVLPLPVPTDSSYQVVSAYQEALANLSTSVPSSSSSTTPELVSFQGYLGARLAIAVRSDGSGTGWRNRAEFTARAFGTRFFQLDDLVLGPYSGTCVGKRAIDKIFCDCSAGLNLFSIGRYKNYPAMTLEVVEEERLVPDPGRCRADATALQRAALLALGYESSFEAPATTGVVSGLQHAQNTSSGPKLRQATYQYSTSTIADGDELRKMEEAFTDRHLTASLLSIIGPSSYSAALPSTEIFHLGLLPSSGTVAHRFFERGRLNLFSTLEQELTAVAAKSKQVATTSTAAGTVFYLVSLYDGSNNDPSLPSLSGAQEALDLAKEAFRGAGIDSNTVEGSLVNNLAASSNSVVSSALPTLLIGTKQVAMIWGLGSGNQVTAALNWLLQDTDRELFFASSEAFIYWDKIEALIISQDLATSTAYERIHVATNLPNWRLNSSLLSAQETLPIAMREFLAAKTANPLGSKFPPLELASFLAGKALLQLLPNVKTAFFLTPSTLLNSFYETSVISILDTISFGPFTDTPCSSKKDTFGRDSCQCNNGARTLNVFDLREIFEGTSLAANFKYTFSSCYPIYPGVDDETSDGVNPWVIVIVVGVAIAMLCLILFVSSKKTTRRDYTKYAVTNVESGFAVMFTDIQSSTALWARAPEVMGTAIDQHHTIIRGLLNKYRCYEVKTIGDSFMIVCDDPCRLFAFGVAMQEALLEVDWDQRLSEVYEELAMVNEKGLNPAASGVFDEEEELVLPPRDIWNGLRVRAGMHFGVGEVKLDPTTRRYDYYGTVVNAAARVESLAKGGQFLVSIQTKHELISRQHIGGRYSKLATKLSTVGDHELRGIKGRVEIFEVPVIEKRKFEPIKATHDNKPLSRQGTSQVLGEDQGLATADHFLLQDTGARPLTSGVSGALMADDILDNIRQMNKDISTELDLTSHFLSTLFSVFPAKERSSTLATLLKGWRIPHSQGMISTVPLYPYLLIAATVTRVDQAAKDWKARRLGTGSSTGGASPMQQITRDFSAFEAVKPSEGQEDLDTAEGEGGAFFTTRAGNNPAVQVQGETSSSDDEAPEEGQLGNSRSSRTRNEQDMTMESPTNKEHVPLGDTATFPAPENSEKPLENSGSTRNPLAASNLTAEYSSPLGGAQDARLGKDSSESNTGDGKEESDLLVTGENSSDSTVPDTS